MGNRWFKNYESAAYGPIGFARALELSCDTFFYRVGLHFWEKYGSDPTDVDAKDPLIDVAKDFGFGRSTGIDLPGSPAAGLLIVTGSRSTGRPSRAAIARWPQRRARPMITCMSLHVNSVLKATTTVPVMRSIM
ncbi:MAG: penicillin-binding transpeptidase domain-containing protein [Marmoricola sp.]